VSSVTTDEKQIRIKDLRTKQPVTVGLNGDSAIHKLPPMMAYALARRFNPDFRAARAASGNGAPGSAQGARVGESPTAAAAPGESGTSGSAGQGPGATGRGMRNSAAGDLSQMLDRLPKINASDLKPGDAVVVSGSPTGTDKSQLLATSVIAGVEPIFQSASPRQAQSLGDWGASLSAGDADTGMPPQ
jgi:hypothetical protein